MMQTLTSIALAVGLLGLGLVAAALWVYRHAIGIAVVDFCTALWLRALGQKGGQD